MKKITWILLCIMLGYTARPQRFMFTDIANNEYSSNPSGLTNLNGYLLFAADDQGSLGHSHTGVAAGRELWLHNGAAFVQVKDINPGLADSNPEIFVVVGGIAFFRANDGVHGIELWRTDGTTAGTYMVRDIYSGSGSSFPSDLVRYNNMVFFNAYTATGGYELWRSDGTSAGTVQVKDINPGTVSSSPMWFKVFGSYLYFSASTLANGRELWRTDGTSAGTTLFIEFRDGSDGSTPSYPTVAKISSPSGISTNLFFRLNHPTEGWTVMKSNGTVAGTAPLKPGADLNVHKPMLGTGLRLYFVSKRDQLWVSDGTAAGTRMVKEIIPGDSNTTTDIDYLTAVAGTVYFVTDDVIHGDELWKSNGTEAGTAMVADLRPGAQGSYPNNLKNIQGTLYFAANAPRRTGSYDYGNELWKTDGTDAGTVFVKDFFYGNGSPIHGDPANLTLIGNLFYLTAREIDFRNEIWYADLTESTAKGSITMEDAADKPVSVQLFPNPTINTITLSININKADRLNCTIINIDGKTVQQKTIAVAERSNRITLETAMLASGTYTLIVKGMRLNERVKFVKQ
jgi:ELWxxDGT repeat protein